MIYKSNCKKGGFSLVEVLMTLLILSLIMVLMAPVITKKTAPKKSEGIVYTYRNNQKTVTADRCFVKNKTGNAYTASQDCSEYSFTVPQGVTHVDLTLVAGGGGGGGAAGGKLSTTNTTVTGTPSPKAVSRERLKSIIINYLTAQGETGHAAGSGTLCYVSGNHCAGTGGSSSIAISNFTVPEAMFRSAASLTGSVSDTVNINATISNDATGGGAQYASLGLPNNEYRVTPSNVSCLLGGTDKGLSYCMLGGDNIIPQNRGAYGFYSSTTDLPAYKGRTLFGGSGGASYVGGYGITYGSGGKGQDLSVPDGCTSSACTPSGVSGTAEKGKGGYISYSYSIEAQGGPGSGGSGGAAVRILGFPVTAGRTYTVYVGKGGAGGAGGSGGISEAATEEGSDGVGGVSTSIWDGNTLLFLVTGGVGGTGGAVATSDTDVRPTAAKVDSYPIFAGTQVNNVALDEKVSTKTTLAGGVSSPVAGGDIAATSLQFPFSGSAPYTISGNSLSSFSGFENSTANGFYTRTLVGNKIGYVGGLGGFSGLGTKAGCGGLFQGTANRFNRGGAWFNVGEYYDGCAIDTPNGQTAEFVMPNPVASTLGKAGSGGGGGGFTSFEPAGKGGRGQNGYLMIEWKR